MNSKTILTAVAALLSAVAVSATTAVTSSRLPLLPFPEGHGIAGAYIGCVDDSSIIVAGGSDFEDLKPWEGGAKSFFDTIYIIAQDGDGYRCDRVDGVSMPVPMGNGCSVVAGNTLYCLGGLTGSGYSSSVVRIAKDSLRVSVEDVGSLPEGFRANAAACWNGSIYVHGVSDGKNVLYMLQPECMQWTRLAPCPGRLLEEGSTFTCQYNGSETALYLIGGRSTDDDGLFIARNVWEYLPLSDTWHEKAAFCDGEAPVELMYTASVAYGKEYILCFGGDDGVEFRRRISLGEQPDRHDELVSAFTDHPGFSDRIWAYRTTTDTWTVLGHSDFPLPAVTTAAMLGGRVLLTSGEEHPGVRNNSLVVIEIRDDASSGWGGYAAAALLFICIAGLVSYLASRRQASRRRTAA